jgi:hypothetical protein
MEPEFVNAQRQPASLIPLISVEKLQRALALDGTLDAEITFGATGRPVAVIVLGGGSQFSRIPLRRAGAGFRVAQRLEPRPAELELRLRRVTPGQTDVDPGKVEDGGEKYEADEAGVVEFGAGPWRVRRFVRAADAKTGLGGSPDRGKPLKPVSSVPLEAVFFVRVPKVLGDRGQAIAVMAVYPDGSRRRIAAPRLVEDDGAFWTSEPLLLVDAFPIPIALARALPNLCLAAGGGGGVGGGAGKPTKLQVGDAVEEDDGTPPGEAPVTVHIFRADDNGAFWAEMLAGNIDWDDQEVRAEKEGWEDSDENPFATKEEILAHLRMLDGDDIWVYSGHMGFRQPDNPNLSDNRPNYFVGWARGDYTFISKDEIVTAIDGHPPGLVALSGCQTWDVRDYFAGAKIVAGFTTVVDDKESDKTVKRFLDLLWDGQPVAEAELAANRLFQSMFINKSQYQGSFRVECADKTKTIYELLGVPRKPE